MKILSQFLLILAAVYVTYAVPSRLRCHTCDGDPRKVDCVNNLQTCKLTQQACLTVTKKDHVTSGCSPFLTCKHHIENGCTESGCQFCCYGDKCNFNELTHVFAPDMDTGCDPNPCENGGTCYPIGDEDYECVCPPRWGGDRCHFDLAPCTSNPCQNNGVCIERPDGGYVCECQPGYTGTHCEIDMDPCNPYNPCSNGGTCRNDGGDYDCDCPPGWTGDRCEIRVYPCDSQPCLNDGTCRNDGGDYDCDCPPNWTGDRCETSDPGQCKQATCMDDCTNQPDGYHQSCHGCHVYVTCANGITYDDRPCPAGLVWDDNLKRCEYTSETCC